MILEAMRASCRLEENIAYEPQGQPGGKAALHFDCPFPSPGRMWKFFSSALHMAFACLPFYCKT